jgi:hypothetical protein
MMGLKHGFGRRLTFFGFEGLIPDEVVVITTGSRMLSNSGMVFICALGGRGHPCGNDETTAT